MEGVTTAIVAFLFVCIVFPTIVKNKPQYYSAFGAILLVILISGLEGVIATGAFRALATFMICLLQIGAMLLLVLSAGGLSWKQLAGEVTEAIEVIRRGETKKEVIIPLRGDAPITAPPEPPQKPRVVVQDSDSPVPLE
jgi:hypothetical protein